MSKENPPQPTITDKAVRFLKDWGRFIRAVEGLLIDNIAATAPWLAPLIPASMVYQAMINVLHFDNWIAWTSAVVIETLGLSAITTTFQFWDWNDIKKKREQRAPVLVAGLTALFYLTVVLIVNVLLDKTSPAEQKWAKGLLSSLSICAGVILALRSQHSRRLEESLDAKEGRTMKRTEDQNAQDAPQDTQEAQDAPVQQVADWRMLTPEDKENLVGLRPSQIQDLYPELSMRTAQLWKQRVSENGFHEESDGRQS
jgi:hypothetical protein